MTLRSEIREEMSSGKLDHPLNETWAEMLVKGRCRRSSQAGWQGRLSSCHWARASEGGYNPASFNPYFVVAYGWLCTIKTQLKDSK